MAREYLEVLRTHGFMHNDMSLDAQLYALNAIVSGFFLVAPSLATQGRLADTERAEILAQTVHNAFEPESLPSATRLEEVAPQVIELFTQLCQALQQRMEEELG